MDCWQNKITRLLKLTKVTKRHSRNKIQNFLFLLILHLVFIFEFQIQNWFFHPVLYFVHKFSNNFFFFVLKTKILIIELQFYLIYGNFKILLSCIKIFDFKICNLCYWIDRLFNNKIIYSKHYFKIKFQIFQLLPHNALLCPTPV